jgi:hypothetical protein
MLGIEHLSGILERYGQMTGSSPLRGIMLARYWQRVAGCGRWATG